MNQNKDSVEAAKLQTENEHLKERIKKLEAELSSTRSFYEAEMGKINFERFLRLNYYYLREHGPGAYFSRAFRAFFRLFSIVGRKFKKRFNGFEYRKELRKILKQNRGKKIMLFYPGYDWYMKMYQRPQHMAIHFSEKDVLFFYCTTNIGDNVDGFVCVKEGLYVTDQYEMLKKHLPKYTLYMCANMNGCYAQELKKILSRGNKLLYEYIDDLHEDLTSISEELISRHRFVLKNSGIPVVTTAQHLYRKAAELRGSEKNLLLSTNGVVYEDFHIHSELPIPEKIADLVAQGKPIIGYYGALAKWFDYELVEKIAVSHPEWNVLLIGIDYDKSFAIYDYFKYLDNVFYIGTVEYKELVKYGNACSVLTIPFLINEITLSTSPVKVFEYMSMEKPIVTTALPECRKYRSVLIGEDHGGFITQLEKAISMQNDAEYKALLKKEALENTWTNKVNEILGFIRF